MATYSNKAEYNAAVEQWKSDVKVQVSKFIASYSGTGLFTFELFYKFEALLAWGLTIPLPFQLGFPDTPKNRDAWVNNVNTFYTASLSNDLRMAKPVEYIDLYAVNIPDIPKYVAKKSGLAKATQALAIVAVICVGAVVIAGALAGTAAGAAATATGGASAVATVTPAVASTVTTATAATVTGTAAATAAQGLGATMIAAAKTGAAWVLKTAATSVLGSEVSQHFQKEIVEEQEKAAAAQAAAIDSQVNAEIKAMEKEAAALAAQTANTTAQPDNGGGGFFLPVSIIAALFSLFS